MENMSNMISMENLKLKDERVICCYKNANDEYIVLTSDGTNNYMYVIPSSGKREYF